MTCMKEWRRRRSVATLDAVLPDDMIEGLLPGFAHIFLSELGEGQKLLKEALSGEGAKHLESAADVLAGAWLDALAIVPNFHLGDGDVVCALRYQLGVCPASMQDRLVTCECDKSFAPGRLCGVGVVRVCAQYAMTLPLNAIGVCVLRDLHRPAPGIRLMLTCRVMLLWILL
jgi:hypothetical protein